MQQVSVTSTPADAAAGYAAAEVIQLQLNFSEVVQVSGTPYVVLNIGGRARRAAYVSGAGTRDLNFEYTVQASDFDEDGVSVCSSRFLDTSYGRIALNRGSISAQSMILMLNSTCLP